MYENAYKEITKIDTIYNNKRNKKDSVDNII